MDQAGLKVFYAAGGYAEALSGVCEISERSVVEMGLNSSGFHFLSKCFVRGIIVEKLVEYMSFKTYYETVSTREEVPVKEFMERIPPEIVLELSVSMIQSIILFNADMTFQTISGRLSRKYVIFDCRSSVWRN